MQNTDLKELLDYIDPASLNYQEWVNVGMALKYGRIHCSGLGCVEYAGFSSLP